MKPVQCLLRVPLCFLVISFVVCAPPKRGPAEEQQKVDQQNSEQQQQQQQRPIYEFAYSRYLEQVVKILESDPKFTEKLKSMPESDIKEGKIADHIDELEPHVFDQLTKVKLAEIERLRAAIQKQIEIDGGAHNIKVPEHIDVNNLEKFGKEDLRNLIRKTVADMDEIDRQRKQQFKEYEMKKKAEFDHKVANLSPEEREKLKREMEERQMRHNAHEKVNHPGSRDQLEEVWEDSDKLDKESYNPRTFFNLHDLDGDGYWDAEEIEALFQLELQKLYNDTDPDDDPSEKVEEMYRMREHVVKQMDRNGDRLISLDEFLADAEAQTKKKDEQGWKDIGDESIYSEDELRRFEEEYAKQKGWGDTAYSTPAPTSPPPPVPRQQEPVYVPQQPVQPVAPQQQQQQPAYQQPLQPVSGNKTNEANTVDPRYGI